MLLKKKYVDIEEKEREICALLKLYIFMRLRYVILMFVCLPFWFVLSVDTIAQNQSIQGKRRIFLPRGSRYRSKTDSL